MNHPGIKDELREIVFRYVKKATNRVAMLDELCAAIEAHECADAGWRKACEKANAALDAVTNGEEVYSLQEMDEAVERARAEEREACAKLANDAGEVAYESGDSITLERNHNELDD